MPQYKNIVNGISKRINWEAQVGAISLSGEISEKCNPLFDDPDENEERVFRLSDALKLKEKAEK